MPIKPITPETFWQHVQKTPDGCWLWLKCKTDRGYGVIRLHGLNLRAHRVAYEFFIGPIPDGMLVCHRCDTPSCVRPDHLFLGTCADNVADMMSKGRYVRPTIAPERLPHGESHYKAKLTDADVIEIRRATAAHEATAEELADRFRITKENIRFIVLRKTWRHLD